MSKPPSFTWDYWSANLPFVRHIYGAYDNARYWDDYYRNTGFKARYPARTYQTNHFGDLMKKTEATAKWATKMYNW